MPGREIDDELVREIGNEVLRLQVGQRRVGAPQGAELEQSAFRILATLVRNGPMPAGEIAERLRLEQSTVSRQLKAAVSRGLVEYVQTPGKRSRLLRPLPEGERAYRHDIGLRSRLFRAALHDLGRERVEELAASLKVLNDALEKGSPGQAGSAEADSADADPAQDTSADLPAAAPSSSRT